MEKLTQIKNSQICYSILESNASEGDYVDLIVSKSPIEAGITSMPDFYIDEEIEKYYNIGDSVQTARILPAKCEYKAELGKNVGFRIPIKQ